MLHTNNFLRQESFIHRPKKLSTIHGNNKLITIAQAGPFTSRKTCGLRKTNNTEAPATKTQAMALSILKRMILQFFVIKNRYITCIPIPKTTINKRIRETIVIFFLSIIISLMTRICQKKIKKRLIEKKKNKIFCRVLLEK